ncbi:chemotaxis protein CheR [Roseomonas sp. GC11]|uniref:CheR family methyltransferase n=1 Tax=Roseomonas sp. GC11 TaxID=2950546 RepID=UPI00210B023C|nr:CheR family methyltransferase [Roseomonas sp. GC11]MCQ4159450.1 chemotaxis protein CheR [Roseomonas sp. GC11]
MSAAEGHLDHLHEADFLRLASFIEEYSGIKMPPSKRTMLEGRLRKRVMATGCQDLREYCHYLFKGGGLEQETVSLIDAVTTNKTEFFREVEHFRILAGQVLPQLLKSAPPGRRATLRLWSVAASIGAEAYTMAMVMDNAAAQGRFDTSILGTDISTRVLQTAALGIYPEEMAAPVPEAMRRRYLMRGQGRSTGLVRVVPELRAMVRYRRLNLMDAHYPLEEAVDVAFCRNVLIYFDKPTQQAVLERVCTHLRPGGFLFLGHSETLAGFGLPVKPTPAATVFQKV